MRQLTDILIIGGGPAGAFAARQLARANFKVTVLEKSEKAKRKVCGEYLCPLGLDLLRKEGLEDAVLGSFPRLRGMKIVTASSTVVMTDFPFPQKFEGVSVNREHFDANILRAAESAGAEVLRGVEVKSIERQSEYWCVTTTQNVFLTRVLIGADGRKSFVSKTFQNDVELDGRRVAIHAFVQRAEMNQRYGEMHLFKNGAYIGLNPTGDNEMNFSLVTDAEDLKKLGGPMQALNFYMAESAILSRQYKPFSDEKQVTATFPIQHRTYSILPALNVALVGDAAGFVDPLTGEGMYNALLSAQLLSEQLRASGAGRLTVPQEAFFNYQRQYNRVLKEKIILNRVFQKLIRHPWVIEKIAGFLLKRRSRADAFIGIIGNIYSPLQGLLKLF